MRKKINSMIKESFILKFLLILISSLLVLFLVFNILYKIYCEGILNKSDISFLIGTIKDTFQILFFLLVGIITILSYLQARKSLFTPIRTETFKMQMKAFDEILIFFQSKNEVDFTNLFDFDFIVHANARIMFSDFISHFYSKEIKVNMEHLDELKKSFSGAIVSEKWAHKNFVSPEYFEKIKEIDKIEITNPAIQLNAWKDYEYGIVSFSAKFNESSEKLTLLIASPLIPLELKAKIEDFQNKTRVNLSLVGTLLNTISQELPKNFPNAKSVTNFDPSGIWNKFNREKEDFEPLAKEILLYIRTYLKIDSLIN